MNVVVCDNDKKIINSLNELYHSQYETKRRTREGF